MSTVLTNGIIIPDNGSRNWGGDLANNWNIIDLNVGYMNDVKNKVTTLENSVAKNTANIQINASNISALQTSKQDTIEDLETIRAGATAGATAVQPSVLNNYYTKTEIEPKLDSKANDADVVHKSGDTMSGDLLSNGSNNLGTTTAKWKTLNGLNPGALSLPGSDSITIDTSDASKWALDGTTIAYTPAFDGWLTINVKCSSANNYITVSQYGLYTSCAYNSSGYMRLISPIHVDKNVEIRVVGDSWGYVRLFPCQGNV